MPIIKNIRKIKETQYSESRIMAIDFGTKRFGISISDEMGIIATPLANYERVEVQKDIKYIMKQAFEREAKIILFGLPKDFNNKTTDTTQQVKSFANLISREIDADIFFWDERYSSKAAERVAEHKEFRNIRDDRIAATLILQGFLDFKNSSIHA